MYPNFEVISLIIKFKICFTNITDTHKSVSFRNEYTCLCLKERNPFTRFELTYNIFVCQRNVHTLICIEHEVLQ